MSCMTVQEARNELRKAQNLYRALNRIDEVLAGEEAAEQRALALRGDLEQLEARCAEARGERDALDAKVLALREECEGLARLREQALQEYEAAEHAAREAKQAIASEAEAERGRQADATEVQLVRERKALAALEDERGKLERRIEGLRLELDSILKQMNARFASAPGER